MARLREIARSGEAQVMDGLSFSPAFAQGLLAAYDGLTPHEQEVFAADCNADFGACVRRCAAAQAALPFAQLLVCLLETVDPVQTGPFCG
jgi:hypothetical protein